MANSLGDWTRWIATETRPLRASAGMIRLIGVDTYSGEDWVVGEADTVADIAAYAEQETEGKAMLKMHAYNDRGEHVFSCGSF